VDFSAERDFAKVSDMISDPDHNFFYILHSDSDSLSFYRLFCDPDVLCSFRVFLSRLSPQHRRLVILFSASLLRYRFCSLICEFCPLCGKKWLWEHFFSCKKLDCVAVDNPCDVLSVVQTHISEGQWDIFVQYLRFYLLEWNDTVTTAAFPTEIIDSLA
jgi:hypothetical protein